MYVENIVTCIDYFINTDSNMISIDNYIKENTEVDEGLLKDVISLAPLAKISPEDLLTGLLDMYDYICDDDDIDLFYQDMKPAMVPMWKNLYQLYQKGAWSIIDVSGDVKDELLSEQPDDEPEQKRGLFGRKQVQRQKRNIRISGNMTSYLGLSTNSFNKITPEFRRDLRQLIKQSRNNKLDLKAGQIEAAMLLDDSKLDKAYIITVNRVSGLMNRMFRFADKKFLIKAFEKMGQAAAAGQI